MIINLSPLKATYPSQSFASIMIHVLELRINGVACPPKISQGAYIYETQARTPKVIKKKMCAFMERWPGHSRLSKKKKKQMYAL